MKLLAWGDTHGHLFQEFAKHHAVYGNTRFAAVVDCLIQMRDICVKEGINYALFAGDMFHKRVTVDTTVKNHIYDVIKSFSDNGITVIMIPGNHDQVDNTDFPQHSLHEFRDIPNVVLLDKFEPYHIDDHHSIYPLPYSKNAAMVKEKIQEYAAEIKNWEGKILLGHLGISGATVGKSSYPMQDVFSFEDLMPEVFQFGIFGHFHKQQFIGGSSHYAYTGSPLQHNFNDEGQNNGYLLADTETGELTFNHLKSPKFITVTDPEVNMEELKGHYVRFQIPAKDVGKLVDEIPEEIEHRIEPQREYENDQRIDIDHSMSEAQVVKKYCEEFRPDAEDVMLEILNEAL